jgi:very-short-patch-repair endonuclease
MDRPHLASPHSGEEPQRGNRIIVSGTMKKTKIHTLSVMKERRRKLRNDATEAEKILWYRIRNNLLEYKFRRQHSIGKYIVDFYCAELKLVVEIDGYIHGEENNIERDRIREDYLVGLGLRIVRYRNEQIIYELDSVMIDLKNICDRCSGI